MRCKFLYWYSTHKKTLKRISLLSSRCSYDAKMLNFKRAGCFFCTSHLKCRIRGLSFVKLAGGYRKRGGQHNTKTPQWDELCGVRKEKVSTGGASAGGIAEGNGAVLFRQSMTWLHSARTVSCFHSLIFQTYYFSWSSNIFLVALSKSESIIWVLLKISYSWWAFFLARAAEMRPLSGRIW